MNDHTAHSPALRRSWILTLVSLGVFALVLLLLKDQHMEWGQSLLKNMLDKETVTFYSMPTELSANGWPAVRTTAGDERKRGWLHGDFRDVAFLYTHRVYEKITHLANLNQTTNP